MPSNKNTTYRCPPPPPINFVFLLQIQVQNFVYLVT